MYKIGINKSGVAVYGSTRANNLNMYASGKSGSGKTSILLSQVAERARKGERVIVFNWHNSLNRKIIMPEVLKEYEKYVSVINVAKDGIQIPLFEQIVDSEGRQESHSSVVGRATSMFNIACNLSPTQEGQLYEAIKDPHMPSLYKESGISVLLDWLAAQKKAVAKNTSSKIRCLCENNIFRDGNIFDNKALIYEFDLNGLEYDVQRKVIEFMMDYFLRMANKGMFLNEP